VSDGIVGGRLKNYLQFWKSLTSDESILQTVSGAKIEFNRYVVQKFPMKPIKCSSEEKLKIDTEMYKYGKSGIIEKVDHSVGEFVNQIFPTPKKNGGVRIILNLKPLNDAVEYKHFKMENLQLALSLMEDHCFMASIDLKDAYYSVSINESYRKYLRFVWNDQLYQFSCLPNGLSSAPRLFTKLMKPIFAKLRQEGFVSVYYLDDIWLMGRSVIECCDNVSATRELLSQAGFLINFEKSEMNPSNKIKFLGFLLDSDKMIVQLTPEKRTKIVEFCSTLLNEEIFSIRFVAKVIGILISSLPAVLHGELYYRFLEIGKINALKKSHGNFDAKMKLGVDAKLELEWWKNNAPLCFRPIRIPPFSLLITTDASNAGWGAVFQGNNTGGPWTTKERKSHINELELKAIHFGLKSFLNNVSHEHIRIQSDNITAVAYINNLGGVKSIKCHCIAKSIWTWAINKDIYLSAEHLPGSENCLADKASRIFDENTEWEMVEHIYVQLVRKLGPFSIDLFASRLNAKQDIYASWKPDPTALFVDAFSANWSNYENFYAFPPFSVIPKCLQKITIEESKGTIIVPFWPTQPWFPKVMRMLTDPPTILPRNILQLPFPTTKTFLPHKNLHLLACRVSGNISEIRDFQKNLLPLCVLRGAPLRLNSMKFISENGFISVVNKTLIPCVTMKLE